MNAAKHHIRAALSRFAPDLVPAQRVAGVNADADDVARPDRLVIDVLERFVDDERVAALARSGGRKHIEPARRDDGRAECHVAWIDQMNSH